MEEYKIITIGKMSDDAGGKEVTVGVSDEINRVDFELRFSFHGGWECSYGGKRWSIVTDSLNDCPLNYADNQFLEFIQKCLKILEKCYGLPNLVSV